MDAAAVMRAIQIVPVAKFSTFVRPLLRRANDVRSISLVFAAYRGTGRGRKHGRGRCTARNGAQHGTADPTVLRLGRTRGHIWVLTTISGRGADDIVTTAGAQTYRGGTGAARPRLDLQLDFSPDRPLVLVKGCGELSPSSLMGPGGVRAAATFHRARFPVSQRSARPMLCWRGAV